MKKLETWERNETREGVKRRREEMAFVRIRTLKRGLYIGDYWNLANFVVLTVVMSGVI